MSTKKQDRNEVNDNLTEAQSVIMTQFKLVQ
jgi:hypothetical protein